ncbi:MAG: hypothetical protein O2816_06390 [Planctomycetota bacterium]|nr:hypothetical protein [Planctomycetota bacterium]
MREVHNTTGPEGEFEIWGLLDRSYTVVARADDATSYAYSEDVPAGTKDALLRERSDAFHPLHGRVVGWNGALVANVEVVASLSTAWHRAGLEFRTSTDVNGQFMLERVPRFLTGISVRGEHIVSSQVDLEAASLGGEITITVEREAPFRVEFEGGIELPLTVRGWSDQRTASRSGTDSGGRGLRRSSPWIHIREYHADGSETRGVHEATEQETSLLWIRESARWLTLHREEGLFTEPDHGVGLDLNPDAPCNVVRVGF